LAGVLHPTAFLHNPIHQLKTRFIRRDLDMPPRTAVSNDCIDQIFREARTHNVWLPQPVSTELLRQAFELAALGPTSANTTPARFVFLTTVKAKERLRPTLAPGNVEKTMAAPVTVIIAWDTEFHEKLPKLFPQRDMRSMFHGNPALIEATAFRNSSLPALLALIAVRCRDSTPPKSTPSFSPMESGKPIFSAI
jgi:hypothetical protein